MLKFTNSKALTLSAMLMLGATTAFGQVTDSKWTGVNAPAPKDVKFPVLYVEGAETPALPGVAVDKGVYYHAIDENNKVYVPKMNTVKPDGNETTTYFWQEGSQLGVFLGDKQKGEVLINLSTKYMQNVRDLYLKLSSDAFGKVAYSTAKWNMEISVFELDGTPTKYSAMYDGGEDQSVVLKKEGLFSTNDPKKEELDVNLFKAVEDPATDIQKLKEGALDNKYIQIKLYSDVVEIKETDDNRSHFAPALVISDFRVGHNLPSMELVAVSETLEAGVGRTSCGKGTLTFRAKDFAYPAKTLFDEVFTLTQAIKKDLEASDFGKDKVLVAKDNIVEFTGDFLFKPSSAYAAADKKFKVALKEELPFVLNVAESNVVSVNSKPEFNFEENYISFTAKSGEVKIVGVTGKNIPAEGLTFKATEKETTDQETKPYGVITIGNEDVDITSCGVVSGKITATLEQDINDITRPEAWTINAMGYTSEVVAVANVGALWLTYEGEGGSPVDGPNTGYTAENVFFAPYDASEDLAGNRSQSRIKTYRLHGVDLKPTSKDGIAVISINMNNETQNDDNASDDQEFRFKVSEKKYLMEEAMADKWINSDAGTLKLKIQTLSDADMKEFREKGIPVQVQFVPNKDGFEVPVVDKKDLGWYADTYRLNAQSGTDIYAAAAKAGLFGDTRANLWSNVNDLNDLDIMHGSETGPFGDLSMVYPDFRKYFGKEYLGGCTSYENVNKTSTFYVAGYNLEEPIAIAKTKVTGDFVYKAVDKLNKDAEIADLTKIEPNEYGEVFVEVIVTFAPKAKPATGHALANKFTVQSGERVITKGGKFMPSAKSEVPAIKATHLHPIVTSTKFDYEMYSNMAEITGLVYEPAISVTMDKVMSTTIDAGKATQTIKIEGTDFYPLTTDGTGTITLAQSGTAFSLKNVQELKVGTNGNFSAMATLDFTPNSMCEGRENTVLVKVGCKSVEIDVEGNVYWGGKAPELVPMNFSDIDGHTATLNWKPVVGAEYYIVKVGHMKPKSVSKNVFISEVLASATDNTLAVELFNGTGLVINPEMMVNYYLKVTPTENGKEGTPFYGHFDNKVINAVLENGKWENTALIVKDYHVDNDYEKVKNGTATAVSFTIGKGMSYKVQLMEGANQIDVFTFGETGAHLARISEVANLEMNRGDFNIADWETTNTSLISKEEKAYFVWQEASNFELSVADGAESMAIVPEGNTTKDGNITTKVYNLKNSSLYDVMVTAYNQCLVNEDGEPMSSINGFGSKFIKTSVSSDQEPTGDVSFEYNGSATGNDPISANAFKVVSGKSSVTIYNAAGKKAVVRNILGQPIAETVISSDNATIAAPAGIVTVAVEGETTVKAIVK